MVSGLVWAVVDGPGGVEAVSLPELRSPTLVLRAQHDRFWCSTQAGGCGEALRLHAGPVVRPYFQHSGGSVCAYSRDAGASAGAYEHLRYQRALQEWLHEQGYQPTLEKVLPSGADGRSGRTDLHVVVEEISHALEVQLSPLPVGIWRERDERYRAQVDRVTWLYGPAAEPAAASEVALRGLALVLRPGEQPEGTGPEVGVRDIDGQTRWAALRDCRLTREGVWAPGIDHARELHAQRAAQETAQRVQEQQAQPRREAQTPAGGWAWRDPLRMAPQGQQDAAAGMDEAALARWEALFPEALCWSPARGWGWLEALPAEVHRIGRAVAYTTQVLKFSSPTATVFPPLRDPATLALLLTALENAGLLRREVRSGVERWTRH